MRDYLEEFTGIKTLIAILGFCGGLLALSFSKVTKISEGFFTILAGLLCACCFTDPVRHLWEYPETFRNGIAFILGISGMSIARLAHRGIAHIIIGRLFPDDKLTMKGDTSTKME